MGAEFNKPLDFLPQGIEKIIITNNNYQYDLMNLPKTVNFIKMIYENYISNHKTIFWSNIKKNTRNVDLNNLNEFEKKLSEKKIQCGNFIDVKDKYIKIDSSISVVDKIIVESNKILGGFIFDNSNFIDNYNK